MKEGNNRVNTTAVKMIAVAIFATAASGGGATYLLWPRHAESSFNSWDKDRAWVIDKLEAQERRQTDVVADFKEFAKETRLTLEHLRIAQARFESKVDLALSKLMNGRQAVEGTP